MNFNDYQQAAVSTAIYPESSRVTYTTLGLVGEAGEVAEKVKKIIRSGRPISEMTESEALEIAKELGDVLWYAANLAEDLGINLNEVVELNLLKLASRRSRGVLEGNGDNR